MRLADVFATTDHYHRHGGPGNGPDTVPAICPVPGRKANAKIYPVSWEGPPGGRVWAAGGLQPAQREHFHREPWITGTDFHSSGRRASLMETADAPLHSGRHDLLYAIGTDVLLKKSTKEGKISFKAKFFPDLFLQLTLKYRQVTGAGIDIFCRKE